MRKRVDAVKDVWIKQALAQERESFSKQLLIRAGISFTVGFVSAMLSPHWWVLSISLFSYLAFFFLWRYILKAWGIPSNEKS